jgi:hypothetical protein
MRAGDDRLQLVGDISPRHLELMSMSETMIAAEIVRLTNLSLPALRLEWHRAHPEKQIPKGLPRDLLVRTIAWKLQERELGRFPPALTSKLQKLSAQLRKSGSLDVERQAVIKSGTTVLREWGGKTYRVTALDDGFLFRDQRFASLSEIAREITGTRWSGPRFFGLQQPASKPASSSDG